MGCIYFSNLKMVLYLAPVSAFPETATYFTFLAEKIGSFWVLAAQVISRSYGQVMQLGYKQTYFNFYFKIFLDMCPI